MFFEHPVTVRASRDQCFSSGFLQFLNILPGQFLLDLVTYILHYATAADLINHGEVNFEKIQETDSFFHTFFFPVSPYTAHKEDVRGTSLFVTPIVPLFLSIDISILLSNLAHFFKKIVET